MRISSSSVGTPTHRIPSIIKGGKGCFIGQIFIDAGKPEKAKHLESFGGPIIALITYLSVYELHPMVIDDDDNSPDKWERLQSIHDRNYNVEVAKNELLAFKQWLTK